MKHYLYITDTSTKDFNHPNGKVVMTSHDATELKFIASRFNACEWMIVDAQDCEVDSSLSKNIEAA